MEKIPNKKLEHLQKNIKQEMALARKHSMKSKRGISIYIIARILFMTAWS